MFNINVNGACKHFVENTGMHETADRLYAAISEITDQKRSELGEVASFVGVTPQVLKNWESRGVSKQGRLDLHEKLGINPDWLATGRGEMLQRSAPAVAAVPTTSGAVTLKQALEVVAGALSQVPADKRQALLGVLATYAARPSQEANSLHYLQSELQKTQGLQSISASFIATGQPPGGKV